MGIGPSTKETSLHHFRDPLLDVVSADEDLDLMGIIIVGTPDGNEDKLLVGRRTAVWASTMWPCTLETGKWCMHPQKRRESRPPHIITENQLRL